MINNIECKSTELGSTLTFINFWKQYFRRYRFSSITIEIKKEKNSKSPYTWHLGDCIVVFFAICLAQNLQSSNIFVVSDDLDWWIEISVGNNLLYDEKRERKRVRLNEGAFWIECQNENHLAGEKLITDFSRPFRFFFWIIKNCQFHLK